MKKVAVIGVPGGWSSERLATAVEKRTGFRCLIDMENVSLDLSTGRACAGDLDLAELDAVIVKKIAPIYSPNSIDRLEILRYLAAGGLKIFSAPERIIRLIDRLSCTVGLRLGDIPMPATVVTEDPDLALEAVEDFQRAVFKPLFTSKARGMAVIEAGPEAREAIKIFKASGNQIMYIQKLVDHPGHDLGVTFLGGEYLATYVRLGSGKSWNTTTRTGGKYASYEPSQEIVDLARKAQDLFGLDFTCVDVVETEGGPLVYEVSAFGGFRGLWEAHGIDAAGLYTEYVLRRIGS